MRKLGAVLVVMAMLCGSAMADMVYWVTAIPVNTDPGYNDAIDWNNGANWSTGSVPAVTDDVVFGSVITGYKTILLNGSQTVNSLNFDGHANSDNFSSGTPAGSTLTVTTGNILFAPNTTTYGTYVNWGTVIPTSVSTATWTMRSTAYSYVSQVTAGADTTIVLYKDVNTATSSARSFGFEANNQATLSSPIEVRMVNGLGAQTLRVRADHALGTGPVTFFGSGNLDLGGGSGYTIGNDININGAAINIPVGTYSLDGVTTPRVSTIAGNLSGSGSITKQTTSSDSGILVLAGTNNTFTGPISGNRGGIMFDGNFTGLGNVITASQYASSFIGGTGNVGMASGSYLRMASGSTGIYSHLVPGRDGVVGTLTVGTDGNSNVVRFENRSRLLIDVAGTESDLLAINGELKLDYTTNALYVLGALDAATDYTLATYTTLTGMFTEVYAGTTVADALLVTPVDGKILFGTTHELQYNANSLDLVALAAPAPHPGDTDNNGTVDVTDLGNLSTAYGTTSGATWLMGDFDGNGMVDVTDLGILSTEYGWVATPPTAGAVPEPATLALLSLGGLALIRRKRS